MTTDRDMQSGPAMVGRAHISSVTGIWFSPDGKLLTSSGREGSVKIWDVARQKLLATVDPAAGYLALGFSPNSKWLAVLGQEGRITLWDIATSRVAGQIEMEGQIGAFQFSPNGKYLAWLEDDQHIKIWDIAAGKNHAVIQAHAGIVSLAFSATNKQLFAVSGNKAVDRWDADTGALIAQRPGGKTTERWISISPDLRYLVSAGLGMQAGKFWIWDAATGKQLVELGGHSYNVIAAEFSADSKTLATGDGNTVVKLWDVASHRLVATLGEPQAQMMCFTLSANVKRMATGSIEGNVKLWDVPARKWAFLVPAAEQLRVKATFPATARAKFGSPVWADVRAGAGTETSSQPGGSVMTMIGNDETLAEPNPSRVSNGTTEAGLVLEPGKWQFIKAYGLDARGQAIPGMRVARAVRPKAAASTELVMNGATTVAADVIGLLIEESEELATRIGEAPILALIEQLLGPSPYKIHPGLVNVQAIARTIIAAGTVPAAPTQQMLQQTGSATIQVQDMTTHKPVPNIRVAVRDPLSAVGLTDATGSVTITGIAPGSWEVLAGNTEFLPVTEGSLYVGADQTQIGRMPSVYRPQQAPTARVQQAIGPKGGKISIPGVMDITIAPEAVMNETVFTLTTYALPDPMHYFAWRLEPFDWHFNLRALATFYFTDAQVKAWNMRDPSATGQMLTTQYRPTRSGSIHEEMLIGQVDLAAHKLMAEFSETGKPLLSNLPTFRIKSVDHPSISSSDLAPLTAVEPVEPTAGNEPQLGLSFTPIPDDLGKVTTEVSPQLVATGQAVSIRADFTGKMANPELSIQAVLRRAGLAEPYRTIAFDKQRAPLATSSGAITEPGEYTVTVQLLLNGTVVYTSNQVKFQVKRP